MKLAISLVLSVLLSACLVTSTPLTWSQEKIKNAKEFATSVKDKAIHEVGRTAEVLPYFYLNAAQKVGALSDALNVPENIESIKSKLPASLLSKLEKQKDNALHQLGQIAEALPYLYIYAGEKLNALSNTLEPVRQNIEYIKFMIPSNSEELNEIVEVIEVELYSAGQQLKAIISEKVENGKEVAELVMTKIHSVELSDVKKNVQETFESLKTKIESTDLSKIKNDAKVFMETAWNNIDKPIQHVAAIAEDLKQTTKSLAAQIPTNPDELRDALTEVQRKISSFKHELKQMFLAVL